MSEIVSASFRQVGLWALGDGCRFSFRKPTRQQGARETVRNSSRQVLKRGPYRSTPFSAGGSAARTIVKGEKIP